MYKNSIEVTGLPKAPLYIDIKYVNYLEVGVAVVDVTILSRLKAISENADSGARASWLGVCAIGTRGEGKEEGCRRGEGYSMG